MADLTTLANVKAWARIPGSQGDTLIARLVTSCSTWIEDVTSRRFTSQSYSEIRDGTGGQELMLAGRPVQSMTSLLVDTVPVPAQAAVGQPGYFLVGDLLCLEGYAFSRGRKNVRVTYTGGFASTPADLEQACIEMVVSAYNRGSRGPDLESRGAQGQSHTWSLEDMPDSVRKVINRYSTVVPV